MNHVEITQILAYLLPIKLSISFIVGNVSVSRSYAAPAPREGVRAVVQHVEARNYNLIAVILKRLCPTARHKPFSPSKILNFLH